MGKILCTSVSFGRYILTPVTKAKKLGHEIIFMNYEIEGGKQKLIEKIRDVDAIIVGTEPIDSEVMNEAKKLKVIAKHGAGVDNIDLEEAKKLGIKVINAPGTNSIAVAEFTWSLILILVKKLESAILTARDGKWTKSIGVELNGKTLGIIGLGKIGKKVATIGLGFGMQVIAYDPFIDNSFDENNEIKKLGFNEILRNSDVLTIHVPLNKSTFGLIGRKEINLMKKTAILVNVARGGIVNEKVLYQALINREIFGAACDVFEHEPLKKNNPLLKLENFIPTPHTAGYTFESLERMGLLIVENIQKIFQGKEVTFRVV